MWTNETLGAAIRAELFETTIGRGKADGRTFIVPLAEMPVESVLTLLRYGVQRKFNDAVGGSDTDVATKVAEVAAMIDEYKSGVTSKRRGASAGVPDETRIGRKLLRAALPSKLGKDGMAKFRALEADAQEAKLDEWLAQGAVPASIIEEELAREKAERVRKASLGAGVSFEL